MKAINLFDTIVAISTPIGIGGISVIRISGDKAIEKASKIIYPQISNKTEERKMLFKTIQTIEGKKQIDNCFVAIFKAPKSYTGEDIVEIYAHGGLAIPNIIIEELLKTGARMATEGEFTRRAFLNNKIDLIQAEAVEEIISAKTKEAVFLAQSNSIIQKKFTNIVKKIKNELIDILSIIEVNIDYPEEELENVDYSYIKEKLKKIKNEINDIIITTEKSRCILSGIRLSIIGKTNVGKSSLMNCLLQEDRAIVSEIHGTTRDYIDAVINLEGIPITIIDTAGIRKTSDIIEEIGKEKAKKIIENSDIIIFLVDIESGIQEEDKIIIKLLEDKKVILAVNKIDKQNVNNNYNIIKNTLDDLNFNYIKYIEISALKGLNIKELESSIINSITNISSSVNQSEILVNTRHKDILVKLIKELERVGESIDNQLYYEFIALDLRKGLDYIGEITGEISTDDILDNIFRNFCVGK